MVDRHRQGARHRRRRRAGPPAQRRDRRRPGRRRHPHRLPHRAGRDRQGRGHARQGRLGRVEAQDHPRRRLHPDPGQGAYLYAKIPQIRELATQLQKGWSGRQLESDLAGTDHPDLHRAPGQATGWRSCCRSGPPRRRTRSGKPIATGFNLKGISVFLNAGDWDRDGQQRPDLPQRRRNGALYLKRGLGTGKFAPAQRVGSGFAGVRLLAAVGDMTGDGWPDLMGQPRGGAMRIYPGKGVGGLQAQLRRARARSTPTGRSRSGSGTPTAPPTACSAPARS